MSSKILVVPKALAAILALVTFALAINNMVSYQEVVPKECKYYDSVDVSYDEAACKLWPPVLAAYILSLLGSVLLIIVAILSIVQSLGTISKDGRKVHVAFTVCSAMGLLTYIIYLALIAAAHNQTVTSSQTSISWGPYGGVHYTTNYDYETPPGSGLDRSPYDVKSIDPEGSTVINGAVVAPGMFAAVFMIVSSLLAMRDAESTGASSRAPANDAEWEAQWEAKHGKN